ncbi:hypothetical protein HDG37_006224 [Paraburkholderia sp. MM5384-R2]|nr:hypothetical protein [Paraburkholderia sp. MM5384-R2]
MSTPAYPIEVAFPDISMHECSGTGIPYLHSFDSGVPGAHVMINALTHGNEVCGAIAVDALLRGEIAAASRASYARLREGCSL